MSADAPVFIHNVSTSQETVEKSEPVAARGVAHSQAEHADKHDSNSSG